MVRQLRSEVCQLQLDLSRRDAELQEKDARIAELEDHLRLLTNGISFRWPLPLPARIIIFRIIIFLFHDIHNTSPGQAGPIEQLRSSRQTRVSRLMFQLKPACKSLMFLITVF